MLRKFTINQNINFIKTFLTDKLYENILICLNNNLIHNDIIYESSDIPNLTFLQFKGSFLPVIVT